jgi:pilus assembly protein CpaE
VRGRRGELGQASVELLGSLTWLVLTALFVWQLLLVGSAMTSASNAARTGSRALALATPAQAEDAARNALRASFREDARIRRSGDTVAVTVEVPIIVPGLRSGFTITEDATLPG